MNDFFAQQILLNVVISLILCLETYLDRTLEAIALVFVIFLINLFFTVIAIGSYLEDLNGFGNE